MHILSLVSGSTKPFASPHHTTFNLQGSTARYAQTSLSFLPGVLAASQTPRSGGRAEYPFPPCILWFVLNLCVCGMKFVGPYPEYLFLFEFVWGHILNIVCLLPCWGSMSWTLFVCWHCWGSYPEHYFFDFVEGACPTHCFCFTLWRPISWTLCLLYFFGRHMLKILFVWLFAGGHILNIVSTF